ncbi:MAG TPA: cytochrome c biogenesis protein ResB [Egibacteraceae bacterium]|nr:cytochrome c biogenesis protein ResB [Egibacteraceae bacterium]
MTQTSARPEAGPGAPPRGPRLPAIPGPLETLSAAWRRLRRMSTALALLFALAAASVVATFVPQEPAIASTVAQWRAGSAGPGAGVSGVLDALGLFDVFGSWWFMALTALLFVSLTGCLIPRYRAFARAARRPPAAGRNLEQLTHHRAIRTALAPPQALDTAERVLRRYRRRRLPASATASGHAQLAAERGRWREGGSLVFHTAFYLLLAGAVIGKAFGFTGQINLVEAKRFADDGAVVSFAETFLAYDAAQPGRFFGLDDHRGFLVTLEDFDVSYHDNLVPRDFVSTVTVSEDGRPVRNGEIRVNHPLVHDGMKLYQARFGFAPRIVVRTREEVLLVDEPVMLGPAGPFWTGSAKVLVGDPDRGEPQLALDLVLVPDAQLDASGQPVIGPSPEPRNPVMLAELYAGDLGLQRPVPASEFDRSGGPVGPPAMLRPGVPADLLGGALTVELAELGYWSGFQVTHAPGRGLLLAAAILVLVGLLPSLHSYRRRVWAEARPEGDGTVVVLAGVALQRKATFTDEFRRLGDALSRELGAPSTSYEGNER